MKMLKSIVFICCLAQYARAQDCSGAGFKSDVAEGLTTASYKVISAHNELIINRQPEEFVCFGSPINYLLELAK